MGHKEDESRNHSITSVIPHLDSQAPTLPHSRGHHVLLKLNLHGMRTREDDETLATTAIITMYLGVIVRIVKRGTAQGHSVNVEIFLIFYRASKIQMGSRDYK